MKPNTCWQLAAALLIVIVPVACGKKDEATTAAPAAAVAPGPAPAAAPAAPVAPAAPAESGAETDAKAAAIRSALAEEAIASDPRGQWAVSATASSTYSGDKSPASTTPYSPAMATGAPNVEHYGDDAQSWATEMADKGIEWLEVKFAKPVQATGLRIRQNNAPGTIIKIDLVDEGGGKHTVWQGVDDQKYLINTIAWFDKTFDKTSYKVSGVRITLATNAVSGWNEIDAVQLLGD